MLIRLGYSPGLIETLAMPEKLSRMSGMSRDKQPVVEALVSKAGGKQLLMDALNRRGWDIKSIKVIDQWLLNGVPAHYCPDIEAQYGIRCEDLCPKVKWGLVRDRRVKARA
jgi:hypothetical protein